MVFFKSCFPDVSFLFILISYGVSSVLILCIREPLISYEMISAAHGRSHIEIRSGASGCKYSAEFAVAVDQDRMAAAHEQKKPRIE